MFKISTSIYSYNGDSSVTLNILTGTTPVTTKTLDDLSLPNLSPPNPTNQEIFMNQPISWWVNGLNMPLNYIRYTPVSNDVNWVYASGSNVYHIGIPISNLIIPNSIASSQVDPINMVATNVFVQKFGMSRVDTVVFTTPMVITSTIGSI